MSKAYLAYELEKKWKKLFKNLLLKVYLLKYLNKILLKKNFIFLNNLFIYTMIYFIKFKIMKIFFIIFLYILKFYK